MTGTNENFKVGRVMIVDDEPELLQAICDALTGQGYETRGFASGADALKEFAEQDSDLLLTDLMMPEMDGIVLLKAALEIDPNLVGIIMTGHGTVQTAVEAMKLGAFDYMLKPFKLATLLPLLSRAMEVRHLRMENMQLHETVAIHELGKAIAFSSDLSDILSKVADAALHQCRADEASIMLPTRDGKELYVAVVRGGHGASYIGERMPLDQGVAGWAARHREPVVLNGEVNDQRFCPLNPRTDIRAAVSMPMLAGGNLVGVLNVNVTRPAHRYFTLGQVKALSVLVSIIAPMLENSRLYIQLRQAEEKYRTIFENAIEGIFQSTPEGKFITANPALATMLGYNSPDELISTLTDVGSQLYVDPEERTNLLPMIAMRGRMEKYETRFYRRDGKIIWVSFNIQAVCDEKGSLLRYEGTLEDITERKRAEKQRDLNSRILQTLNRPNEIIHLIRDILIELKEHTESEAVAIRLQEGDDFPYYETNGFPPSFLEAERYLCARDSAGDIICDSKGNAALACLCGVVIRGQMDTSLPFFTPGGSFWTNSTTEFLRTADQDLRTSIRQRCHLEGYESMALIPLRSRGETIGLLQLNDRQRDSFTLPMIEFLERIGASIGIAVARLNSVEQLRKSEEQYRRIVETSLEGIWVISSDFRTTFVNNRMAEMLGYTPEEIRGREVDSFIFEEDWEDFALRRAARQSGKAEIFERRFRRQDGTPIWNIVSSSPFFDGDGQFIGSFSMFTDISERKRTEKQLQDSLEKLRKAVGVTIQVMIAAIEVRDPYTAGHQLRVAQLARAIATELNMSEDKIEGIGMAGSIHDIGKLSIPAEILSKPTRLTDIEFALIKEHARKGFEILKDVESSWPLAEIVYSHHERMDGSGYPRKLPGEEICLEARVLAVSDTVEAMASHRPYRPGLGIDAALAEIEKNRGALYDAAVVDACLKLFREQGYQI